MIRAAAKNHDDVTVVVQPSDYQAVMDEMDALGGATSLTLRRRLAATAFARTAAYDAAIARRLAAETETDDNRLPARFAFGGARRQMLRYGENPHQVAAPLCRSHGPPRRCAGCADPGQGAELQQSGRCRRGLWAGARVRPARNRHHQARQPLRRRPRRRPRRSLRKGAGLRSAKRFRRRGRGQSAARRRDRARHCRSFHRGRGGARG